MAQNYIIKLQNELRAAQEEIKAKNDLIVEFRKHLMSTKFHNDPTIQVRDVDARLIQIMVATGEVV